MTEIERRRARMSRPESRCPDCGALLGNHDGLGRCPVVPRIDDLEDAKRYRWIKARSHQDMRGEGVDFCWYVPTKGLDEAIDAAIRSEQA
jgi:hypothetical protein